MFEDNVSVHPQKIMHLILSSVKKYNIEPFPIRFPCVVPFQGLIVDVSTLVSVTRYKRQTIHDTEICYCCFLVYTYCVCVYTVNFSVLFCNLFQ
jgi:hypothetical protein